MAKRKKPGRIRVPRTEAGGTMTPGQFAQFLRNQLRKATQRWAPKFQARNLRRRQYTGDNKRRKWEYQCDDCREWFRGDEIEEDHNTPVGSFVVDGKVDWIEYGYAWKRALCDVDGFGVTCKPCHKARGARRSQSN